jgi:S-adenosylmethionine:tRNA ribosyltransferase-isomerase
MNKSELQYEFPEELIAREPQRPSRICSVLIDPKLKSTASVDKNDFQSIAQELKWEDLISFFEPGDVLILNNTKVLKRRIFTSEGLEILFLGTLDLLSWEVLFPSKKYKVGSKIQLPGEVEITLVEKGRPQKVKSNLKLEESYFEKYGELPLPPYIQKVRDDRHTNSNDNLWYQTAWSEKPGSFAAPTASLHFTQEHLTQLKNQGVRVCALTLHVGLGTFLPVEVERLTEHMMHHEFVEIPQAVINEITLAKKHHHRVWSMGTTVTRALESYGGGYLRFNQETDSYIGDTNLLILPGFSFQIVDRLLTNFHQPESTLLALVMAFAGVEKVKSVYEWAIKNKFRLFSYGDLSVWSRTSNWELSLKSTFDTLI